MDSKTDVMPNLNDICKSITESVDHAYAAAVIDEETGLLLGVSANVTYFTQSYMDTVAAAAVELFRGKGVSTVEKMLGDLKGQTLRHTVKEIQMTTDHTYHFMTIVPDKPGILAVLVTGNEVNLGMGWAGLRSRLKEIADICP